MPSLLSRLFGAQTHAPTQAHVHAQKASRTGALVALQGFASTRWSPRNYVALTQESYERNAVAYRAVRMVAEAAASIPWRLYEDGHEIEAHPLLDLVAWPNPTMTGADLIEALVSNLLLFGNAYIEAAQVDGTPRELFALRPDRMSVVAGRNGWPAGYDYTVAGQTVRFDTSGSRLGGSAVAPILHMKLFHPLDDHYGLPPLAAAQVALDTHNAAGFWNKALLDNAARPSGALVYAGAEGHLTEAQFERLRAELTENFAGAANAGRPLLLEGGLDWKAMSLTPKDMDFIEAKAAAAREIALAFGVPPLLLGLPGDNTRTNYVEANLAFWRGTVIPTLARLQKNLGAWLAPAFGGTLTFDYDVDRIDALSADRAAEWKRVGDATFLTDDEKRAALGYGPKPPEAKLAEVLERRYSPDQPRDDHGRWASGGGGGSASVDRSVDRPTQIAQNRGRGIGSVTTRIDGELVEVSPGQAARLSATQGLAESAVARVREVDRNWKPEPTMSEGVEGAIARNQDIVRQADARYGELQATGLSPGPFAGESVPARSAGRDFTRDERREIGRIGRETGCHTCGTTDPGTPLGSFVADHQPPSALNFGRNAQRLYPHCLSCSLRQGGYVNSFLRRK